MTFLDTIGKLLSDGELSGQSPERTIANIAAATADEEVRVEHPDPAPPRHRTQGTPEDNEHVILVAFHLTAPDRVTAEEELLQHLPQPGDLSGGVDGMGFATDVVRIEEWWVAEDDRRDRSDNDSAVFVHPGAQQKAHDTLRFYGLTAPGNDPSRQGRLVSRFEAPER